MSSRVVSELLVYPEQFPRVYVLFYLPLPATDQLLIVALPSETKARKFQMSTRVRIHGLDRSCRRRSGILNSLFISVYVLDGREGAQQFASYDATHVGASALPAPLVAQLKPGGRMVIPVGNLFQQLKVVDKRLDGSLSIRTETSVSYVPLTSRAAQLQDY